MNKKCNNFAQNKYAEDLVSGLKRKPVFLYTIRGKEREAERQSEIEKEEKDRVIIFFLLG